MLIASPSVMLHPSPSSPRRGRLILRAVGTRTADARSERVGSVIDTIGTHRIDATELNLRYDLISSISRSDLTLAAAFCLEAGYAGQCRQLLSLNGINGLLDADVVNRLHEQLNRRGQPVEL